MGARARDQMVCVLNLRADKCFLSKAENVHLEKGLSVVLCLDPMILPGARFFRIG